MITDKTLPKQNLTCQVKGYMETQMVMSIERKVKLQPTS